MKTIGILTCLEATGICGGCACMRAFNDKSRNFARYADTEIRLGAFLHCNGCGKPFEDDPEFLEKIDALPQYGVETVHVGVCGWSEQKQCPTMGRIVEMLQERGMEIVYGTH